ncbi:MAG: flavodoxin family protein [bacterium]
MEINVLGISGSPVKKGNVEAFLDKMLGAVSAKKGVSVEAVHLSRLDVADCIHCNFCVKKQKEGKYCSVDDDAQGIFEKAEAADVLVLATPVYFLRTSGRMASLIDRLRVFVFGNLVGGKMKNKIGVSAAVAWGRNAGFETTHLSHIYAYMALEMIPASVHHCISPLGASAVASPQGSGLFDKNIRIGIDNDNMGLHSGSAMMNRALELAAIMKRGAAVK